MTEFKILRSWEVETSVNHLLHSSSSEYYSRLNIIFMIPIIIFSSSTGTLGLMNSNSSQMIISNNVNVISLIVGVLGLLSAMLTTIHNFLGIQKLQSTHNFHSVEYTKISREIKMHIYLSETDVKIYANIAEYIKQCRSKIDKLIETAPEIPRHIETNLKHEIKYLRSEENNELSEIIIGRLSQLGDKKKQQDDFDNTCTQIIIHENIITHQNENRHSIDAAPSGISTFSQDAGIKHMKELFSSLDD